MNFYKSNNTFHDDYIGEIENKQKLNRVKTWKPNWLRVYS